MSDEILTPDGIRRLRGIKIASSTRSQIKQRSRRLWLVASQTDPGVKYPVRMNEGKLSCGCPDFALHPSMRCKHMWAVLFLCKWIDAPDGSELGEAMKRPTYSQDWPNYDRAQGHQKEYLRVLL